VQHSIECYLTLLYSKNKKTVNMTETFFATKKELNADRNSLKWEPLISDR
ncbi:MAG: hypothetical protein ACI8ZV_002379, partial [Chitinophagales bacterium]